MDFKNALQLDAMDTSHPIEVPVGHPDEVDEIFDHIRYNSTILESQLGITQNSVNERSFDKCFTVYIVRRPAREREISADIFPARER